ncbi:hypothetical protein LCGC14_0677230 [marine sediment metagenome]|uniref:Uncharacterized protein n=1 Tax=marine sediment metagenome TaxID=412755 RepID=A0A0F9QUB1_9ZZZZ
MKVTEESIGGKEMIDVFPFYDLEDRSLTILEELLEIVDNDERHGYRDSIMDLEDNLAIAMMLIQKYNDMGNVRNGYTRNMKDIHDEAEIRTHKRGGDFDYERVLRVLTK